MNKRLLINASFGLVVLLLLAIFSHYWFVFRDNLFIQVAFLDENKTAFPIAMIAKVKARKIDTKLSEFLQTTSNGDVEYRKFFSALQNGDKEALVEFIDPKLRAEKPDLVEQSAKELIQKWGERSEATFEYILPGSKFSYLIHSIKKGGEKIWFNYRFRFDGVKIYYLPFDNKSTLVDILRNWFVAISEGWYGGIAPENKHYDVSPIGYIEYWTRLTPLNSQVSFGDEENNLTLYFNSFKFSQVSTSLATEIENLYAGFIDALEIKNIEAFSNFVSKKSLTRLRPIFDQAYSVNYEQFVNSFDRVQLYSFVDAKPLRVIYFQAPEGKYVEPMFILEEGGAKKFSGIGFYSSSTELFRVEEVLNLMQP